MPGFGLNREQRRAAQAHIKEQNKRYGPTLSEVPRSEWPDNAPPHLISVMRSSTLLVQVYKEPAPLIVRLSVSRSELAGDRWADRITWDELQDVKAQAGYADALAVEVYPPAVDVVNVANMRHLWVYFDHLSLPFIWRKKEII